MAQAVDADEKVARFRREVLPWLDRPVRVMMDCGIRFGVELLCYTPEEYERKRQELGIVRTAALEGVTLLGG